MENLKQIIKSYEAWVAKNPEVVGDFETTAKYVSYFIAGRISDSNVVSELIYTLSNMLVLYNDRIIEKARGIDEIAKLQTSKVCNRLKVILTTLEYSEVFIEISAKRVLGNKGKWIVIGIIQFMKAAGRLFILKNSSAHIITSPSIPMLNRRALIKEQKQLPNGTKPILNGSASSTKIATLPEHSITFQLKRSGRLIRKVEGAPPLQFRDFNLKSEVAAQSQKLDIPQELLTAEYLYIAKPLIHLASMGLFGRRRWKHYIIALSMDLMSIHLYRKNRHLMSKEQKLEMSRRCINLLMYLMRTPFYEDYTKSKLDGVINFVENYIPFAKMLANPLREYIPHWQSTYFYMWST